MGQSIIPIVEGETLVSRQDEQDHTLTVGTSAWFAWLETASAFSFISDEGRFTARHERSSQLRGGRYWKAYRKQGGQLFSRYLGKSEVLTLERLRAVAVALSEAKRAITPADSSDPAVSSPPPAGDLLNPLLETRLRPPRLRTALVSRSHLVQRLQEGMAGPLTLLSAPAGYGKTTLLGQWLAQSATPVAWLSLEAQDNDPVRFLPYLLVAIQMCVPDLALNTLALLEAPQSAPLERVLAVLTNELMKRRTRDFALVLDDYQIIEAAPIHQALAFLLDHLPPQLHLVLATRADPPLPLARLRARGHLTELRAADLQLQPSEAETFLQAVMGLHLPARDVLALQRRTEGWVAGLQLAALSLHGREDVSTWLSAFTGSHRFVSDYLSEEVLSRLPAPWLSFLLHTSVLERLSGSLCDAVTQQQGSQNMLETLERANLFVVPLDEERCWYRYHHLFAELLQSRLQRTQPELVAPLHRQASLWYEQHHQYMEAVQHALAAHAFELAARLIEHCAEMVMVHGQMGLLLDWLNALPEALVRARPLLCIYHACTLHVLDHLEEAEARLLDAERTLALAQTTTEQVIITGMATVIRAHLARYAGDLEQALAFVQEAPAPLPPMPVTMRAALVVHAAHAFLVSGDATPDTEQQVTAAVNVARSAGYRIVHFRSLILLARLQMVQGRLRAAAATYEQAEQATPGEVLQVLSASALYCFALGNLLREWNRLDEAEHLLVQGMAQIGEKQSVYGDDLLHGYVTLIRLDLARGRYNRAEAHLGAFLHLAERRYFPAHIPALGRAMRAQIELAQGRLAAAVSWADASDLACPDAQIPYRHEQEYLILARVRIAQGREDPTYPRLQETLHLLGHLQAEAEAKARMSSTLEILIVQALALDALGKRDEALSALHEALRRAEPEGYIRLFVDEGEPMRQALQALLTPHSQQHEFAPSTTAYVAKLLASFEQEKPGASSSKVSAPALAPAPSPARQALTISSTLGASLTRREQEVLRLLAAGASNQDIAQTLVISLDTVKKHVSNLLGKLGASSRTQAVALARTRSLL